MKKILIAAGIVTLLCIAAGAALFLILSRVPFTVPTDRMTTEYVLSLSQVDEFQLIGSDEEVGFAVFGRTPESTEILVRAFTTNGVFDEIEADFEARECGVSSNVYADTGSVSYSGGRCDDAGFYLFEDIESGRVILFETAESGTDVLNQFIEAYIQ